MREILKLFGYTEYEVEQYLYFHTLGSYSAGDIMLEYLGEVE
jgi:sugar-specific transcriptional regulator TrmB